MNIQEAFEKAFKKKEKDTKPKIGTYEWRCANLEKARAARKAKAQSVRAPAQTQEGPLFMEIAREAATLSNKMSKELAQLRMELNTVAAKIETPTKPARPASQAVATRLRDPKLKDPNGPSSTAQRMTLHNACWHWSRENIDTRPMEGNTTYGELSALIEKSMGGINIVADVKKLLSRSSRNT